ncbi:MAG: hypothetical protein HYU98_03190, partial [Deltaproteobacteria bacterium]|nr:hypothetical protein [Deltaproteobacteria bacterium]
YDGDHHLDIALQTPDGHWIIDYGGIELGNDIEGITINVANNGTAIISFVPPIEYFDKLGSFDKDVKYLTDEQLSQAPGWAWLGDVVRSEFWNDGIVVRIPDGIQNASQILLADNLGYPDFEVYDGFPAIFGDNSIFLTMAKFSNYLGIGLKGTNGEWKIIFDNDTAWGKFGDPLIIEPSPNESFGDILCRPIPADYDGDGKDDRAVQCGTSWKIVYSSSNQVREIELDQALDPVPAYVYAGGIKYQDTVDLYNYYKEDLSGTKDSTIFDAPPPIGPYFAQCVKYWAPNASYCWNK